MHLFKITMTQIAEEMGVTKGYISLALGGGSVSEKQRQRIEDAIDLLVKETLAKETSVKTDYEKRSK